MPAVDLDEPAPADQPAAPPAETQPATPPPEPVVQRPAEPEVAAPPRLRPEHRPTGPITVPPKLRPMAPAKRAGYIPLVLMVGVLFGLMAAAYFFSGPISRVVPGADMIYKLLGLSDTDPSEVLQLGNIKYERRGESVLSIKAELFNPTEYPLTIPPLMLKISDANGDNIGVLPFRLQQESIEPGETISFQKIYQDPPKGMKGIGLAFGSVKTIPLP
jgi:hypothetical protein